jgi:crotonobetainyl-CoA:carnitine CoA-transferase CaiB-like acyl-CoA transferase
MTIPDVLEDRHIWEREVMMETELDGQPGKKMLVPGPSFIKFSKTPTTAGPIPKYGEHNQEIYGSLLGLDDDRLAAMVEEGVIT